MARNFSLNAGLEVFGQHLDPNRLCRRMRGVGSLGAAFCFFGLWHPRIIEQASSESEEQGPRCYALGRFILGPRFFVHQAVGALFTSNRGFDI